MRNREDVSREGFGHGESWSEWTGVRKAQSEVLRCYSLRSSGPLYAGEEFRGYSLVEEPEQKRLRSFMRKGVLADQATDVRDETSMRGRVGRGGPGLGTGCAHILKSCTSMP